MSYTKPGRLSFEGRDLPPTLWPDRPGPDTAGLCADRGHLDARRDHRLGGRAVIGSELSTPALRGLYQGVFGSTFGLASFVLGIVVALGFLVLAVPAHRRLAAVTE